jgi:multiple sugar transport system permease protein
MLYGVIVFLIPVLLIFLLMFFRWSPIDGSAPFVGLRLIRQGLTDGVFWASLLNSAKFLVVSVPPTVILALLASVACASRSRMRLRRIFKMAYFLPLITCLAVTAFIWLWFYNPAYGLFNNLLKLVGIPPSPWLTSTTLVIPSLGIMYVWARTGFEMAILIAGLEGIPDEFYEAAKIDGAGPLQSFLKITLPLMNPQIVLVTVLEVITSLKTFELPYVTTQGGPINASRTAVLHIYDSAFHYMEISKASVDALVLFIVIILITLVQMRLTSRKVQY